MKHRSAILCRCRGAGLVVKLRETSGRSCNTFNCQFLAIEFYLSAKTAGNLQSRLIISARGISFEV